MQTLYQILGLVGAVAVIWIIYRSIKGQPQQFSRENMSKSFSSLGILALILIAFVGGLIFLVNHT